MMIQSLMKSLLGSKRSWDTPALPITPTRPDPDRVWPLRVEYKITREHDQWWIYSKVYNPLVYTRWHVCGNSTGNYEDILAKYFHRLNNSRLISAKVEAKYQEEFKAMFEEV